MKPSNFSWIDETLAASALPTILPHLDYYLEEGITNVISVTIEKPAVMNDKQGRNLKNLHLSVYSTPSEGVIVEFLQNIIEIRKRGEKAVIHCQFGQERTGMLLAIYLIEIVKMEPTRAIKKIQRERPNSLRTHSSIKFLRQLYNI